MDFTNDSTGPYAYGRRLDAGLYLAVVTSAKPHRSKNGPCLHLGLGVDGGPEGGVRLDRYIRTDIGAAVRELLAALAPQLLEQYERDGSLKGFDENALVGLECAVLVELEPYEGRMQPKAQKLLHGDEYDKKTGVAPRAAS